MLLTEFDEKKFAKTMWTEGHESGYNSDYNSGSTDVLNIMDAINQGNNTIEKLTALGYDPKMSQKVLEKMK